MESRLITYCSEGSAEEKHHGTPEQPCAIWDVAAGNLRVLGGAD